MFLQPSGAPRDMPRPTRPPAAATEPPKDLRRLGEELRARTEDVVRAMALRTRDSGQLVAQRAAPLNEVTKRCLRWWNATEDVVCEIAAALQIPPEVCSQALAMLQRSLSVTLVRMCESFETERQRADGEL